MREFLLRIYAYMKRLPEGGALRAAVAVALAMLEEDDSLAVQGELLSGGFPPEKLNRSLLDHPSCPGVALGAALAAQLRCDGAVVISLLTEEAAASPELAPLLALAIGMYLPVVFLVERGADFSEDLQAQAALGDIERVQADAEDAMKLMPALRLAIDKAREGDGPTLVECVSPESGQEENPLDLLADVLITEGYAAAEELL